MDKKAQQGNQAVTNKPLLQMVTSAKLTER